MNFNEPSIEGIKTNVTGRCNIVTYLFILFPIHTFKKILFCWYSEYIPYGINASKGRLKFFLWENEKLTSNNLKNKDNINYISKYICIMLDITMYVRMSRVRQKSIHGLQKLQWLRSGDIKVFPRTKTLLITLFPSYGDFLKFFNIKVFICKYPVYHKNTV